MLEFGLRDMKQATTDQPENCPQCNQPLMKSKEGVVVCINCGYSRGLKYVSAATPPAIPPPAAVPIQPPAAQPPGAAATAAAPATAPPSPQASPTAPLGIQAGDLDEMPPVPRPTPVLDVEAPAVDKVLDKVEELVPVKMQKPIEEQVKTAVDYGQDFKSQYISFLQDEKNAPVKAIVKTMLVAMGVIVLLFAFWLLVSTI